MEVMAESRADRIERVAEASLLDETGFQRLYADAARDLWGYLFRVIGQAAEAEDLMQDAFVRVLRAPVGGLDLDGQRAYLFRVASHLAVDRFRRERKRGEIEQALGRERPPATSGSAPDLDLARRFAELKPQERALLWMAYVEGSAHEEIAESLKLKPASVRVLLFRARTRLRALLARSAGAGR
jgi:RNA polymerase sigma-70 factor (ECF subfamily)